MQIFDFGGRRYRRFIPFNFLLSLAAPHLHGVLVLVTGNKFIAGVVVTGDKLFTGVVDTGDKHKESNPPTPPPYQAYTESANIVPVVLSWTKTRFLFRIESEGTSCVTIHIRKLDG
jgi:hypothetical protein